MKKSKEIVVVPVVIDTNILVPSIYRGTHLFYFIRKGNILPVWNQFIFDEAKRIAVDLWAKYKSKTSLELDGVFEALNLVYDPCSCVPEMPDDWPPVSPDRADDPFLWAALQGKAEYIISHDESHMLKLGTYQGIPIGAATQFFDWVKVTHPMETPEILKKT